MNVALETPKASIEIKMEVVKQIQWMFAVIGFFKKVFDVMSKSLHA